MALFDPGFHIFLHFEPFQVTLRIIRRPANSLKF